MSSLGDSLAYLSIVQALQRLYPDWKVHACVSEFAAGLFQAVLPASQLLVADRDEFHSAWKHPLRLRRLLRRVREWQAQAALLGDDQPNTAYLLARLAGGATRVGPVRDFIKVPDALTHEVAWRTGQGIPLWNWEMARMFARVTGGEELPVSPPVPSIDGLEPLPLAARRGVVIHPGAGKAYQRWDAHRFAELARRLAVDHDVIWFDQEFTADVRLPRSVERLTPRSLQFLLELLCRARLFVGNNSGPMHVAAMAACPSIILNGPSHPVWDPMWNTERISMLRAANVACQPCDPPACPVGVCANTREPMACLNAWSAREVFARCENWMEHHCSGGMVLPSRETAAPA
ncbi:MAG: glycosyltransferase family 9 protein [Verrucomicrobiota bacterium]